MHGGNLRQLAEKARQSPEAIIDFSANINPLGPPPWLRPTILRHIENLAHYPDPDALNLTRAIAAKHGIQPERIIVANGSSELISIIPRTLAPASVIIPVPSYLEYARAVQLAGINYRTFPIRENQGFCLDTNALRRELKDGDLLIIGQPNNPTGRLIPPSRLLALAKAAPAAWFLVDEAFIEFVKGEPSLVPRAPRNMIILRSMTKFYAIPGLRLGYAVVPSELAERIRTRIPPWSVNTLAQVVGEKATNDHAYAEMTRAFIEKEKAALEEKVRTIPGLRVFPSDANFLLIRILRGGLSAPQLAWRLLRKGIAIRVCDNFAGLGNAFFRIAVRTTRENEALCNALAQVLARKPLPRKKKTHAIMLQGTSSNAGKSILATAICRILLQDGYDVAPFKAQNMSLNSFVTRAGHEMGRAQVVQAQACRLEPDARMNPILLKPTTDTSAQLILNGKPLGTVTGTDPRYPERAWKAATAAYDSLAREHDVVVLEGAGSPGEINLKDRDIVNMRMADYAGAPVLLAGDIDRGGVFASFVGTINVLEEWERRLVAGFIINRFRGAESLLAPTFDYMIQYTGRPVLGIVPFIPDLGIPEEDSVEFKNAARFPQSNRENAVDIAAIDLPYISNFTDLDPFLGEPDVNLRIVRSAHELGDPDALIIPGSKNVIHDLHFLQKKGLARAIHRLAQKKSTEIVGICAGLQLLGNRISDPHGIESANTFARGLGILPVSTVLARKKTLTRTAGRHIPSGHKVVGYEIHHGQTKMGSAVPMLNADNGRTIGVATKDGMAWGTYLHGIFDADEFRRWFIDRLRKRRGLAPVGCVLAHYNIEPALERLAAIARESLDIQRIYRIMGLE